MDDPNNDSASCNSKCCTGDKDIEIVVGECLPDGQGGCQRSRGRITSCCTPASQAEGEVDACCSECPEDEDESCKNSCCATEEDKENKPGENDQCCDECSGREDLSCEDDCCVTSAKAEVIQDKNGLSKCIKGGNTCEDLCCGGDKTIASSGHEIVGKSPSPPPEFPKADACCNIQEASVPSIRRRAIHTRSHEAHKTHKKYTYSKPSVHTHSSGRKCEMEHAFGRFFEAACCCLIEWHGKAKRIHHHSKKVSTRVSASGSGRAQPRPVRASPLKKAAPDYLSPAQAIALTERGGSQTKYLVLTVRGMDCPSCATKLTKVLASVPSVTDIKVNTFTNKATMTYVEGIVLPEDIAQRASVMTSFICEIYNEGKTESKYKRMRIELSGDNWTNNIDLPTGVVIHAETQSQHQITIDVEYDSSIIQPRVVLAVFAPWKGAFIPSPKTGARDQGNKEVATLVRRTSVSTVLTVPVLIFAWAPLPAKPNTYGGASLALATLIQTIVAAPLYSSALRTLFFQRTIDMDLLVVLSSTIAYVYSAVAFFTQVAGHPFSEPFFETPTLLITLIILGRLISAYARRRATSALDDLSTLQADTVTLLNPDGTVTIIPAELVHKDDILRISPDTLVPTDGTVVRGASHVDESALTGESALVEKHEGSELTAGSMNTFGVLDMNVKRVPSDNTVSDIGRLLSQVQDSRLPVQDLADRVASYLAPVILIIAVIVFVVWVAIGISVRHQSSSTAGIAALRYAIAVLVISCPCALVLCVPMVVVIASAVAAKEGVLFKSVQAIQSSQTTRAVVFDKTGTLTSGRLRVVDAQGVTADIVPMILGLISSSKHPVAQGVAAYLRAEYSDTPATPLQNVTEVTGKGIEAYSRTKLLRGGNVAWLELNDQPLIQLMRSKALTIFAITSDNSLVAAFGLADTLRPSASAAIKMMKEHGAEVHIVSGDEQSVVNSLAAELGIPLRHAVGGCLPQTKQDYIRALQETQKRRGGGAVMFVGDGTNDALALAQADIGISLSSGTDIALSAADVVILASHGTKEANAVDLARCLRVALRVSRGAGRRMGINFGWSFVYNVLAVLLAAGAFVDVRVAPQYAAIGEMVSVVPVVLIAWSMWLLKE